MSSTNVSLTLLLVAMVTGCSTYAAPRYSISADNVVALRGINGEKLEVGPFTASTSNQNQIMCRAVGPIKTPDGEPFSEYVRKALIDELRMANRFSDSAAITLTGNLDSINFSSNTGNWDLVLTVKSSNGKLMKVTENYSYATSFYGETACNQTAQALMPAVQDLVGKVVKAKAFESLLSKQSQGASSRISQSEPSDTN